MKHPGSAQNVQPEVFQLNPIAFKSAEPASSRAFIRRHSISLENRAPPRDSLAAELLGEQFARPGLLRTKSMLDDLRDIADQLSDFVS